MRYLLALLIAGFVIGGISLTAHQMKLAVQKRIRKSLFQARDQGEFPVDPDLDQPDFAGTRTNGSTSKKLPIDLLDLWYWLIVLIPLAIMALDLFTAESRSSDGKAVETNHSP